ncbi:hypothetical protein BGX28_001682 [Mortierella sp. GBA30]|nr:hypothetical protein BGX28_001682 [Mortierella sp. GBA30]
MRTKYCNGPRLAKGSMANLDPDEYFEELGDHLATGKAKDLVIRVGEVKGDMCKDDFIDTQVHSYVVDQQGQVVRGLEETVWSDHNPRYHRYRWGEVDVQSDRDGHHYCDIHDIQMILEFDSGATYRVDGNLVEFLSDDSGRMSRIKYYPKKVIEVSFDDTSVRGPGFSMRRIPSETPLVSTSSDNPQNQSRRHEIAHPAEHEATQSQSDQKDATFAERQLIKQQFKAIWAKNYELHEHPIPRLFIVLPQRKNSAVPSWDPSNLFQDKFRLYFLCEGCNHCESDINGNSKSDDPENHVHLALHEGYELLYPEEFFLRYGRYVLGMLQFLEKSHALNNLITDLGGNAITVADRNQPQEAFQVEEMVKHHHLAQMALSYLENIYGTPSTPYTGGNAMLIQLQELGVADLRRLETFLRKDNGRVLGNLWRFVTPEGHVKWVCKYHHARVAQDQESKSVFLDVLSSNHYQGRYDENLQSLTISFTGSKNAASIFGALVNVPYICELNVTLKWKFSRGDLESMVKMLNDSSVQLLTLDLKDKYVWKRPNIKFQLLSRKYQALLSLFQNPRLKSFRLLGASRFGVRTDSLPDDTISNLRSLHFRIRFVVEHDQEVLKSIIQKCPHLVDLRLGGVYASELHKELRETIGNMAHLQILHLYGMEKSEHGGPICNFLGKIVKSENTFQELVLVNSRLDAIEIVESIKKCESTLETLVLDHPVFQPLLLKSVLDNVRTRFPNDYQLLRNVTSLHLHVPEDIGNIRLLARTLKGLSLTHLGLSQSDPLGTRAALDDKSLLDSVNFAFLRSLFLSGFTGACLAPLWASAAETNGQYRGTDPMAPTYRPMESLSLEHLRNCPDLVTRLNCLSLKTLWVVVDAKELGCEVNHLALNLDFSSLRKVALFRTKYAIAPKLSQETQMGLDIRKYFEGLEASLGIRRAKDLIIRVGEFEGRGGELGGMKVHSFVVNRQGLVALGPKESTNKGHNPRYHRYRWGMSG